MCCRSPSRVRRPPSRRAGVCRPGGYVDYQGADSRDERRVCRWKLTGHIDVGGFDPGDRFSLHVHASLGYRTALLTRPALLRVGNAVLFQEYEQGDFTGDRFVWNMTGHGPTAGVSITF